MTGVRSWSTTAANNVTANTGINWDEGMAPAAVNNSARATMADVAAWYAQIAAATFVTGVVGGTGTAITLTNSPTVLALTFGQSYSFALTSAITAATTLNVDGLGAKAVQVLGAALVSGAFNSGDVIEVFYDGTAYQVLSPSPRVALTGDTFKDTLFSIVDDGDVTKIFKFQASGITTGTTRTWTIPDATDTFLGLTGTQSPTNKTFDNTNTVTLKDTLFTLQDDGDTTKQAKFQLSGITTGTTRTFTFPDANATLARIDAAQTFTGVQTMTSPAITTPAFSGATTGTWTIGGTVTINAATLAGTISGGGQQLNNIIIGTVTPLAGAFTTLSATGALTYGGVTLTNAVTGTGNMALSINPAFTGIPTINNGQGTASGLTAALKLSTAGINAGDGPSIAFYWNNFVSLGANIAMSPTGAAAGDLLFQCGNGAAPVTRMVVGHAGAIQMTLYGAGAATFDSSGNITSVSDPSQKLILDGYKDGLAAVLACASDKFMGWHKWRPESGMETEGTYASFFARDNFPIAGAVYKNGKRPNSFNDRPVLMATVNAITELAARDTDKEIRIAALEAEMKSLKPHA